MASRKVPKALVRSEHDEQVALFAWADLSLGKYPELGLMFAIPNFSGRLGKVPPVAAIRQAQALRAEGRKAGVPDIFFPVPAGNSHGLFLEMKRVDGKPSSARPEQLAWHQALIAQGYRVFVCYGFEQARDAILGYINGT
jgi:hypothetical protein